MTASLQKNFERAMLHGLLKQMSIPAEIASGDFESPDLVMAFGNHTIGVEVTEIQKSKEERARRAPKDDIVRRAKQKYEASGRSPISVTFSFTQKADIRSVNRSDMGLIIADLLGGIRIDSEYETVVLTEGELPSALKDCIREIRLWREEKRGIWQCSEASWVAPLTPEVLQERVDAKKVCLSKYRMKGYDAYWLLICAHPTNPACRFEVARDFDPKLIESPFDRTFFYDGWHALDLT